MTATQHILETGEIPASLEITGSKPFNYKHALETSEAALLEGSVCGMNGVQWKKCCNDFDYLIQETERLAIVKLMLRLHSVASN